MKQIILLHFFLICFFMGFCQGNLQFNRSLFLKMEIYHPGDISATASILYLVDTIQLNVPVGKTVKVETIRANFVSYADFQCLPVPAFITSGDSVVSQWAKNNTVHGPIIKLDEVTIFREDVMFDNSGSFIRKEDVCPIWLPSGNYIFSMATQVGVLTWCGNIHDKFRMKGFISAIEFNIVP